MEWPDLRVSRFYCSVGLLDSGCREGTKKDGKGTYLLKMLTMRRNCTPFLMTSKIMSRFSSAVIISL
jgi:hypothetical protein